MARKPKPLDTNFFIILSLSINERRWDGKGFSKNAAKVYSSFEDACDALKGYWFHGVEAKDIRQPDDREVIIKPLTQHDFDLYLTQKLIRF